MSKEYTYEKVSDYVVKIITTETIVTDEEITIPGLRERKTNFQEDRVDIVDEYDDDIVIIDGKINLCDDHITEAQNLGVEE